MTTIKAFTDLEQSKKLAEILPPECADMEYIFLKKDNSPIGTVPFVKDNCEIENSAFDYDYNRIPCWSLASLLNIIPISYKGEGEYCFALINTNPSANPIEWCTCYEDSYGNMIFENYADNPVDACVTLIIKLHELKML